VPVSSITHTAAPATRPAIPLLPFVLAVVALAYGGCHMAVGSFAGQQPHAPAVGEAIATNYGSITVTGLEMIDGLTSADLGGRVHGVSGLVTAESAALRLSILLTNSSRRTVPVSLSDFSIATDAAAAGSATAGTAGSTTAGSTTAGSVTAGGSGAIDVPGGSTTAGPSTTATSAPGLRPLPPGSSLEATVVFVVPRTEADLAVSYAAPGSEPIAIAAGRTTDGPLIVDTHVDEQEEHP